MDPELQQGESETSATETTKLDAPLSFVPHSPAGAATPPRIRTQRYGEMEAHELLHLLDSIEDERARARFREAMYISVFVWIIIAAVVLYGPRYLWHSPQLISPAEAFKAQELTSLNAPVLSHKPLPVPKVDTHTLAKLRAEDPPPRPVPPPPVPTIKPTVTASEPLPSTPSPNLPSAPAPTAAPRATPPIVADAPRPQPSPTRPNFGTPGTASDSMSNAVRDAARNRAGSGGDIISGMRAPNGANGAGGVEVLSDMQGVDFSEYLKRMHRDVLRNWLPLLPEETEPPISKKGQTIIVVTILPDGTIGDMKPDGSTHDESIDRAAWGSITSEGKFQPLPSQFHGPNLVLRFTYDVNVDLR
jgi:hypothetical protein